MTAIRVADGIVAVDTMMANRAEVTSAYVLEGSEPTLVETGPTTSFRSLAEGSRAWDLGPNDLAHVVVTHIHLDHAGGVGRVAEAFPRATVWVHDPGAPHLADPTKLLRSAARVYGEERMRELFGPVDPVRPGGSVRSTRATRSSWETDAWTCCTRPATPRTTSASSTRPPAHCSRGRARHPSPRTWRASARDAAAGGGRRAGRPEHRADPRRGPSLLLFSHFGPVLEVDELCRLAACGSGNGPASSGTRWSETDDLDRIAQILATATAGERPSDPEARGPNDLLSQRG